MKSILVLLVAIVSAASFAGCGRKGDSVAQTAAPDAAKIEWLSNFETAKARASAQHKTLLINFTGSDWCPPCIMLNKQVFSQPEFLDYAEKNLVLMEVDFPRRKELSQEQKAANEKLAGQFEVAGFPTVVLLNASGNPLGALGYHSDTTTQSFIAEIEELRGDGTSIPLR